MSLTNCASSGLLLYKKVQIENFTLYNTFHIKYQKYKTMTFQIEKL